MEQNVVERNFVLRFALGMAVFLTMAYVGKLFGRALLAYGVPYGDWIGVGVGAVAVFVVFSIGYTRLTADREPTP
ncbi:hypothetical protein [Halopiger goleimassiliensis]|uniref:hypothetical protein n=1 Tax=Halopiger goleimassiliensis TaxID=1293048 RepID=UPI000677ECD0|nr:hypothetical protein [Halopiger goleimassiliensis]